MPSKHNVHFYNFNLRNLTINTIFNTMLFWITHFECQFFIPVPAGVGVFTATTCLVLKAECSNKTFTWKMGPD